MSKTSIPVEKSFEAWRNEPGYREAYDALEEEFSLAAALIEARGEASQEEIAERMRTSQSTIARLESGRANPSLKTLQRYAAATGTRIKISFEPQQNR